VDKQDQSLGVEVEPLEGDLDGAHVVTVLDGVLKEFNEANPDVAVAGAAWTTAGLVDEVVALGCRHEGENMGCALSVVLMQLLRNCAVRP